MKFIESTVDLLKVMEQDKSIDSSAILGCKKKLLKYIKYNKINISDLQSEYRIYIKEAIDKIITITDINIELINMAVPELKTIDDISEMVEIYKYSKELK